MLPTRKTNRTTALRNVHPSPPQCGGSATLHGNRSSPARGSPSTTILEGYFTETQIGAAVALDRYLAHAYPSARVCRPTLDWSRHPPSLWGMRAVGDVVNVGSHQYRVALLGPHRDPSYPYYGQIFTGTQTRGKTCTRTVTLGGVYCGARSSCFFAVLRHNDNY